MSRPVVEISGRKIGPEYPPYVVAEMSGNHLRDLERAEMIIREAKAAGADAVKIQTYTPDSLSIEIPPEELASHPQWQEAWGWNTGSIYKLYEQVNTPQGAFTDALFALGKKYDIPLFSTPFGLADVELLESRYNPPAYKIAALEANFSPLVELIGRTGKPVIINVAVMTQAQIDQTLAILDAVQSGPVILLSGPKLYNAATIAQNWGLGRLAELAKLYSHRCVMGTSDHFLRGNIDGTYYQGHEFSVSAVLSHGGCLIEKHFCGCRSGKPAIPGEKGDLEGSISLVTEELQALVFWARLAHEKRSGRAISRLAAAELELISQKAALGWNPSTLGPSQAEIDAHEAEALRYLYAQKELPSGHRLTLADLHFSRATHFANPQTKSQTLLPPCTTSQVVGLTTSATIHRGDPIFAESLTGTVDLQKPYAPGLFRLKAEALLR